MQPGKARYLTKSRFKEGWECPTRLFYTGKPAYGSTRADDAFLRSLADGGFQVGALARLYHPGGVLVETLDVDEAARQTDALLAQKNAVIFEGAIRHGNLLARVDVLVKHRTAVKLIEVKSKSFDSKETSFFNKAKKGKAAQLSADWEEYIADVAFQLVVFQRAYPALQVTPHLMLADKSKSCTVDGLHQKFLLRRLGSRRTDVLVSGGNSAADLGAPILTSVDVSAEVAALEQRLASEGTTFAGVIDTYAEAYAADRKLASKLSSQCRVCPYRIGSDLKATGLHSGFDECWGALTALTPADLQQPLVIDMARLDVEQLVGAGFLYLADLEETHIKPKDDDRAGLSFSRRRWLQVDKLKRGDTAPYLDVEGLTAALSSFVFPLHMIDFETLRAAVPFYQGDRPYAQIAFQFSHHVVYPDVHVAHKTQYLDTQLGKFPNFDFVRALRAALGEEGTVFRYAAHENTVLCDILSQLEASDAPLPDRDELIAWIKTITHASNKVTTPWQGARDMVDMLDLVKRYYYHPATNGSNSFKYVLPATIRQSEFLRDKYTKPIYGAAGGIASHNFTNWAWIRLGEDGCTINPYDLLPPLFAPEDTAILERLYPDDEIREGGAAMTAYARMQYTEMSADERAALAQGLLKYCELDTFAMVLLYEY